LSITRRVVARNFAHHSGIKFSVQVTHFLGNENSSRYIDDDAKIRRENERKKYRKTLEKRSKMSAKTGLKTHEKVAGFRL